MVAAKKENEEPKKEGKDARWLRERSARIGIIMVTVASDTVDRVVGLETGADDYIAKPFEPRELLARVKSVLRRAIGAAQAAVGPRVRMGRRVLDLEKRVLVDPANGSEETLTASEFDLLRVFAEHPNKPLQRDWLLEVTAHRDMEPFDRAIDLRITRLRRKIELDPAHPNAIRTVRGVGYMFVPPMINALPRFRSARTGRTGRSVDASAPSTLGQLLLDTPQFISDR